MSNDDPTTTALVPYAVGYGRPPAERRFKPGASGNPRGRPRGSRKETPATLDAERAKGLLLEEAYRPVALRDGDRVIELPAIQAVFRAMGVSAMKGNRFAQKTLAELVGKIEAERTHALTEHFGRAVEYKHKWSQEIDRCRRAALPVPEPIPHPDDIFLDVRNGTAKFAGPRTQQEKAWLDQLVTLMKILQVQISTYAAAKRARSKERRAEHLAELHDYQRQFDQMNDLIAPRYRIELQDRSHHPDASRPGEHARKLGIRLPGPPLPEKLPEELLALLVEV